MAREEYEPFVSDGVRDMRRDFRRLRNQARHLPAMCPRDEQWTLGAVLLRSARRVLTGPAAPCNCPAIHGTIGLSLSPDPASTTRHLTGSGWPVVMTVLISLVFHALVWIAIWNAAGRYEGRRAWGVLARVVVALWAVSVVMFAGWVLGLNVMFWGW